MRLLAIIMTALFLLLQYDLWIGEGSMGTAWKLGSDIKTQRENNQTDLARNNMLAAEVDDLRDGLDAIEERARSELGMIKRDETFIQIIRSEPDVN